MNLARERAADLRRLAQELTRMADEMDRTPPAPDRPLLWAKDDQGRPWSLCAIAKRVYRSRRERERYLPANLFFDPAWDMLLDLFIASCQSKQLATKGLCLAAGVPPTTAIRYIDALVKAGLVARLDDPRDARRTLVVLTEEGRQAMARYLANVDLVFPGPGPETTLADFGGHLVSAVPESASGA
jgi:predicted transcriptional regulator